MPIRQTTPRAALQKLIDRRLNDLLQALVNVLCYAGEEVVKYARDPNRKRYTDQTGNLTSSIGYVVLWDGKVVKQSDFSPVQGKGKKRKGKKRRGAGGVSGSKKGREFLRKLISENGDGLVLIVVAGMPYAAYVEAMGLDVLDSAEIKAEEIVKRILSKLKF